MTKPKTFFVVVVFALLGNILFSYAQCPTIVNTTQNFCDVESLLVSDLQAFDNSGGIVWYDTVNSVIPLNNSSFLINGEDYFADDNTGGCGIREGVIVNIIGPPIGLNFQGVCVEALNEATISDLVVSGNDIQWYLTPTGGTALNPNSIIIDTTIYYADQSNPVSGCRTSRLSVLVNVGFVPLPTGNAIQRFCVITDLNLPIVSDLVGTGNNIQWYSSNSSAIPLDPSTSLINEQSYFATSSDPPCENSNRLEVFVELINQNSAGSDGNLEICEDDNNTYDLFNNLGSSPDAGGTWLPALNSTTGLFDPNVDSPGTYTYTVVTSDPICNDASASVIVSFSIPPVAGSDGSLDICEDDTNIYDLFNNLDGSPNLGGTWFPTLNSTTGLFDPTIDTPGTYTYTVATSNPACSNASASVIVSFNIPPVAGSDGSLDICEDDTNSYDLFNNLGGSPDAGGTWLPTLNSTTGLFDPTIDTPGIYTYTVTSSSPVCSDALASVTVSFSIPPVAGSNGSLDICEDDTNTYELFNNLGGSPNLGGTWFPTLNSTTGLFDPTIDTPGTYTYTVATSNPACSDASASVTVSFSIPPVAGSNGSLDICEDETNTYDLFNNLGGSPDAGGTWLPTLNSTTGIFDPSIDPPGTYIYTVSTSNPACNDASASVIVSFSIPPVAGSDGSLDICEGDTNSYDLFNNLGGSPDAGGTWSPALNSTTGFLILLLIHQELIPILLLLLILLVVMLRLR
ncbi:hypothetical protein [Lacinutrix jangbogonensis]|uniref:hypothetical protein n=1 Tax=Lacinutrix jangbogonensis TaxID=1469557 RepID=UPI00053EE64B|nr:hypothetical protein [Lacinutrix jangbogonensis]